MVKVLVLVWRALMWLTVTAVCAGGVGVITETAEGIGLWGGMALGGLIAAVWLFASAVRWSNLWADG